MSDTYDGLTSGSIFSEKSFEESGQVGSKAILPIYNALPTGNIGIDGTPEFVIAPVGDVIHDKSIVNIDYLHRKIHQGEMLFVSHIFRNIANNGKVYVRHTSGSTKYLHSEVLVSTTGEWTLTSYAGSTYTGAGTTLNILNRKSDSTYTPTVVFRHTPTGITLGTPRLRLLFGSGSNPSQATTGLFSERLESVFAPNQDVLIELTNESGSTQDLGITFNFYEELAVIEDENG